MRSWIESANAKEASFPIQNLPFGVASVNGAKPVCVSAIGDKVINLAAMEAAKLIEVESKPVFDRPHLNDFMSAGPNAWRAVRERLQALLSDGGDTAFKDGPVADVLFDLTQAQLHMPFQIAEYTDFYAGKQHAFNVGCIFRGPENALPPNWLHIPIGYNGRASSVVVSGTPIHRPLGQIKLPGTEVPTFGRCERLDIELELGAVVGTPSALGSPITLKQAEDMIFGYVLLNDWSARDIQAWEYQPLGPFQGKAFGTTISPWIITKAALEPFRTPAPERETPLLSYLDQSQPSGYDIELETYIRPSGAAQATRLSKTNAKHLYYSAAQQLTHHAIGGCAMNTGDLLGSGTISGPTSDEYGSLLEMCWGGKNPIALDTGEVRTFIEDGDELTLRGQAVAPDYTIGFGDCSGTILPAPAFP